MNSQFVANFEHLPQTQTIQNKNTNQPNEKLIFDANCSGSQVKHRTHKLKSLHKSLQ